jgi:hypothetical protein
MSGMTRLLSTPPQVPRAPAAARARGQASVFVIIVAAILVIAALLVYNSGRAVVTRIHLQNAADSAAYSGAVVMARAYNFAAYSNRAMVANQVAIAQMVGLASWSRYYCLVYADADCGDFKTFGTWDTITAVTELFEGFNSATDIVEPIYQPLSSTLFGILNKGTGPIVMVLNGINLTLSAASQAYYAAAYLDLGAAALDTGVVHRVLVDTDPKANLALVGTGIGQTAAAGVTTASLGEIADFIKQYKPLDYSTDPKADPNNRFHNVVMASRDQFSSSRSSLEIAPFVVGVWSLGDCFERGFGGIVVSSLGYHGSTVLSTDNKTWRANDTSPFLAVGVCVVIVNIGPIPVPIPIPIVVPPPPSYGQANVTDNSADKNMYTLTSSEYSGLLPYIDVKDLQKQDYNAPDFTIFAVRKKDSIATTQQLLKDGKTPIAGGNLTTPDGEAQDIMMVAASSGVYFYRPQFKDDNTEMPGQPNSFSGSVGLYGSLFSPYWEPHLVPTNAVVKAAVTVAQGGL